MVGPFDYSWNSPNSRPFETSKRVMKTLLPLSLLLIVSCAEEADSPEPVPSKATTPPVASPRPVPVSKIPERDAEWMFDRILQLHRDWWMVPGKCGTLGPWLAYEAETHRTEGRLFARAMPVRAERLALAVLNDPEAPAPDRTYAWFVLGLLAHRTSPALEAFLAEQAAIPDDDDRNEAPAALSNLMDRRPDGPSLALCRLQARRGNFMAFHYLSLAPDEETIKLLQEMTTWNEQTCYPLGSIPGEAKRALRRIALLQSKDWASKLETILLKWQDRENARDFHWALHAAERRRLPSLKTLLEKRLNETRKDPKDFDNDTVLVAYAEAGGALLPAEEKLLWRLGFRGDSERRLLEVMAERTRHYR